MNDIDINVIQEEITTYFKENDSIKKKKTTAKYMNGVLLYTETTIEVLG